MDIHADNVKQLLVALHQRPIAYYPVYAKLTGSVTSGVLLSQILYLWSANAGEKFPKKDQQLREQTALSDEDMRRAKKALSTCGFLSISVEGLPATTHYDVDPDALSQAIILAQNAQTSSGDVPPTGPGDVSPTAIYGRTRDPKILRKNIKETPSEFPPISPPKQSARPSRKSTRTPTDYTPGFEAWWKAYPPTRRLSKPECFRVWQEQGLEPRTTELVEKLQRLKATIWKQAEDRHIKTSLPYLNSGRYEDDLVPLPRTAMDLLHEEGYFSDRARNVTPQSSPDDSSRRLQGAMDQRITQDHLL